MVTRLVGQEETKNMNEPTEPFAILEIFATDAAIGDLGSGMKEIVFSAPHREADGSLRQQSAVRVYMPAVCLISLRAKLLAAADQVLFELLKTTNGHNSTAN
jgi:hypothetical protein